MLKDRRLDFKPPTTRGAPFPTRPTPILSARKPRESEDRHSVDVDHLEVLGRRDPRSRQRDRRSARSFPGKPPAQCGATTALVIVAAAENGAIALHAPAVEPLKTGRKIEAHLAQDGHGAREVRLVAARGNVQGAGETLHELGPQRVAWDHQDDLGPIPGGRTTGIPQPLPDAH